MSERFKDVVMVLVGHGSPPKDVDREKLARYIELEQRIEAGDMSVMDEFEMLDREIRGYPRNAENDPYWHNLTLLARRIEEMGVFRRVYIAFNEFCAPSVEDAIHTALKENPDARIVVVSTMMMPGGEHSDRDIPEKVERAKRMYPHRKIIYAWPYPMEVLAEIFIDQAIRFID